MTNIQELGGSLEKLLSTLKVNREKVPPEVLNSYYKQPYETLLRQISETATIFVKVVISDRLILNPDIPVDEQVSVINQTIKNSGMEKQMGHCIFRTYSSEQLYQMALELRRKIEYALWPYINLKTCLVFDMNYPNAKPVTYNTLTRQICRDGIWAYQELELWGKFLYYPNTYKGLINKLQKENEYEYQDRTENNCSPVRSGNRSSLPHTTTPLLGS